MRDIPSLLLGTLPSIDIRPFHLTRHHLTSFRRFLADGIMDAMQPYQEFHGRTTDRFAISLQHPVWSRPRYSLTECRRQGLTYTLPLTLECVVHAADTGESKTHMVHGGELPMITPQGTLLIHGIERVPVMQLRKAPGVTFTTTGDGYHAQCRPVSGSWLHLHATPHGQVFVACDQRRSISLGTFLSALTVLHPADTATARIQSALAQRFSNLPRLWADWEEPWDAVRIWYQRMFPGNSWTPESAAAQLRGMVFHSTYGSSGRRALNWQLGLSIDPDCQYLTMHDVLAIVETLLVRMRDKTQGDDREHFQYRRILGIGDLLTAEYRKYLGPLVARARTLLDVLSPEESPRVSALLPLTMVATDIQHWCGASSLLQTASTLNPLSLVAQQRKITAMGPGGMSRRNAPFETRDIHISQYGRVCPVETPEGQNIGLVTNLATGAHIDRDGALLVGYVRVLHRLMSDDSRLPGKQALDGQNIDSERLRRQTPQWVAIRPWVSDETLWLSAHEEREYVIAHGNATVDDHGYLTEQRVICRQHDRFQEVEPRAIDLIDQHPAQTLSVATALIPFVEHDDVHRALMGANMQKQAVPLLRPERPWVMTGMERLIAAASCQDQRALHDGVVLSATAQAIRVQEDEGMERTYLLERYRETSDHGCLSQRPAVRKGERVQAGTALAQTGSIAEGALALGRNVLVAFMAWEGYTFEDAIVVREGVIRDGWFTSAHRQVITIHIRSNERVTRDLPERTEQDCSVLDDRGYITVGVRVRPGMLLLGKRRLEDTARQTPEEKLYRVIFGIAPYLGRDVSAVASRATEGTVVSVTQETRADGCGSIRIVLLTHRPLMIGDKMAGRHGNKGVVSCIVADADMPLLPDGRPVDMIINPLGIPKRMNLGQLLEVEVGWAASILGRAVEVPPFSGATEQEIASLMIRAQLPLSGKITLRDGRTGAQFDSDVAVGIMYVLKLNHLVAEKWQARSTGPYALVTQQPVKGKSHMGGQRVGEMEVWALEAYGAASLLREMTTVQSDDQEGRLQAYAAIVQGTVYQPVETPAAFRVLQQEFRSLGLEIIGQ